MFIVLSAIFRPSVVLEFSLLSSQEEAADAGFYIADTIQFTVLTNLLIAMSRLLHLPVDFSRDLCRPFEMACLSSEPRFIPAVLFPDCRDCYFHPFSLLVFPVRVGFSLEMCRTSGDPVQLHLLDLPDSEKCPNFVNDFFKEALLEAFTCKYSSGGQDC